MRAPSTATCSDELVGDGADGDEHGGGGELQRRRLLRLWARICVERRGGKAELTREHKEGSLRSRSAGGRRIDAAELRWPEVEDDADPAMERRRAQIRPRRGRSGRRRIS